MTTQITDEPTFRTLAELAHCEGVTTGPDGSLWAGDEAGRIYRIDPGDGSHEEVARIDGWALGLALDGDGLVYVCVWDQAAVVRIDPADGSAEVYAPVPTPNFPVFAPDGTLYVSESGSDEPDAANGRVVAVPPGGGAPRVLPTRPLAFANGLAHAPEGTLYVLESYGHRVCALRDGEDATVLAELPGTVPDGLALDAEGGLLVSCFQPNRVLRVPPGGGEPVVLLDDWMGRRMLSPTNVAFFGPERRSLALASLCGWSISAVDVEVPGQPLAYPRVR